MRDLPPAEVPEVVQDNQNSDAPTQLWSGRLSLASIAPRLRAARHRERLEALLNTQTGITFDAASERPQRIQKAKRTKEKPYPVSHSTTPPVVTGKTTSNGLSGIQLAVFIAVGVAVGGIAALQLDHLLRTFARHHKEPVSTQQPPSQGPTLAANAPVIPLAVDSRIAEISTIPVAVAPAQPARTSTKPRTSNVDVPPQYQVAAPGAVAPVEVTGPPNTGASTDVRVPTQLHPRINALMTSNQVFRDQ
jgi:hypothetical protein